MARNLRSMSMGWLAPLAACALLLAYPVAASDPPADVETVTEAENVQRAAEQAPQEAQKLPPKQIVEQGEPADIHSPPMPRRRGAGVLPGRPRPQRGVNLPPQRTTSYRGSDAPFIPPNPDGAYLGIELKREFPEAAIVSRVIPGTAAAAAGLREGDRIWGINEQRVESANELIFRLGQIAPGEAVEVHFDRAHSAPVTLGQRGPAAAEPPAKERPTP
jgi:membrane-associated protease RseP (regulator of RpoE activity)